MKTLLPKISTHLYRMCIFVTFVVTVILFFVGFALLIGGGIDFSSNCDPSSDTSCTQYACLDSECTRVRAVAKYKDVILMGIGGSIMGTIVLSIIGTFVWFHISDRLKMKKIERERRAREREFELARQQIESAKESTHESTYSDSSSYSMC